jgi:general stress protein 26
MIDNEDAKLLWDIVQDIQICMMVTQSMGEVHARPMRGRAFAEENVIWFLTEKSAPKTAEAQDEPTVCLTYADTKRNRYVSLSGSVDVISDHEQMAALWNDNLTGYFGKPLDDRAVLLRFTPEKGEYWDGPGNPLIVAIKFVEAAVTGKRPDMGASDKVIFQ